MMIMLRVSAWLMIASLTAIASQQPPVVAVGAAAPAFTAVDDHGVSRSLADYRGKFVVLEWHEKGCPYVAKHYKTGHMQRLQAEWMARGVVWLLVNSSAEGFHSFLTPEESRSYVAELKATPTAMLLDTAGTVGRLYGVSTALHMVVIDPAGKTIYNGAIDDQPRRESLSLLSATNYVQSALSDAFAGRPVAISTSIPYGCDVHYGRTP